MKIIGITGKAGAGKTTFSDYLGTKEGIGVIHIDDLFSEIKSKYLKFLMNENKEKATTKLRSNHKTRLYTNPLLFKIFMKFRSKSIEKSLNRKIKELSEENDIILVDDIFISYHKIYQQMKEVFLIQRPYIKRCMALIERDELSKEEIVLYDRANDRGNHEKISKSKKTTIIANKRNKEDLEKTAEQLYRKKFKKAKGTMQERYKSTVPIKVPHKERVKKQDGRKSEKTLE